MTPPDDGFGGHLSLVEQYLDTLADRLHGSVRDVRGMLAESQAHLLDAVHAYVADGLTPDDAQSAALRDFGDATLVAASMNQAAWSRSRRFVLRETGQLLVGLAAIGMVVVGVAGVVARLLATAISTEAIFGIPAHADVSAASCAHWLSVQSSATTCQQAGTLEAATDQTAGMVLTGTLGLLLLVGLVVVRRRRPQPRVLPPVLAPAIATTAFGAAAIGLAALAASDAIILSSWGRGLWWTSAACSLGAGCVGAGWLWRAVSRSHQLDVTA